MDGTVAPAAIHVVAGQTIAGRYLLVSPIAGGGAATVWRAIDTRLGREVAVKIVSANEHERHRLEREARAVASLDHPAILPVHDVVADGASTAIVMPLVRGESLATRLAREGRLPERTALMIVGPIASALAHAHVRGVIHCDVKPGNILLDTEGRARLADFGIARPRHDDVVRHAAGVVEGTLFALAPERLSGMEPDTRADVFALGVVLYECLTGRAPWVATNAAEMLRAEQSLPPLPTGASPAVTALLAACLATEPGARPTAAAVASTAHQLLLAPASAQAVAPGAEDRTRFVGPPPASARPRPSQVGSRIARTAGIGVVAIATAFVGLAGLPALAMLSGTPGGSGASPAAVAGGPAGSPRPTGRSANSATRGPTRGLAATEAPTPKPTPRPTPAPTPRPTPRPTAAPTAAPLGFQVLEPADGSTVAARVVVVAGLAPPLAWITRDIPQWPDDHVQADRAGRWTMTIRLQSGLNVLTFRLGDDRETEAHLSLISAT